MYVFGGFADEAREKRKMQKKKKETHVTEKTTKNVRNREVYNVTSRFRVDNYRGGVETIVTRDPRDASSRDSTSLRSSPPPPSLPFPLLFILRAKVLCSRVDGCKECSRELLFHFNLSLCKGVVN